MELYPHQQKAVDELHNGAILWGGVGSGKTITSLFYFYTKVCKGVTGDPGSIREPHDLYVITTAKKRDSYDWQRDAAMLGLFGSGDVGGLGITLTVDSWNNIGKYEDVKDAFFIFDEQRLVGSGAWTQKFIKIAKHNKWILLTATPGDTWLDYIPVFVANGFYKNRTEFKRNHVVYNHYSKFPKVDHYVDVHKLVRLRNQILVEMPYMKHTVRHIHNIEVDYDREMFEKVVKKRWHVYENRPLRDVGELFIVMRRVVNTHASRLQCLMALMERHPRLIVFYNFDYELEILRGLASDRTELCNFRFKGQTCEDPLPCGRHEGLSPGGKYADGDFEIAEWNGHKHENIPDTRNWMYLVQYAAGAEGWNCTLTDAMVFYSLTYSYKMFHQAQGRIDRLNTPYIDLNYYVLMSNSLIDKAIWKSLGQKKNFNESDFSDHIR